ncbi:unnamed protein product [Rotaria sordida]|uniref:TIR domain-containing protein n=2 Tax=Rotaria sordida TaxID=392033 RepID=A0A814BCT7_9BILA|nr:unnamed protein product [Rotaria sordida]
MNDPYVLDHPLFVTLRDTLISFLHENQNNQTMYQLAKDISSLISNITIKFVNTYVDIFKRLLIYKPLINKVSEGINKCAQNIGNVSEEFIEVLNNLLFAYERLIHKRLDIQDDPSITILFESVAKCFVSHNYEEMLEHVGEHTEMSIREEFFFARCPLFLHQCRSQHRRHILNDVRKILLPLFNKRLPLKQINKSVIMVLGSICAVLFICSYGIMNNEAFYDQYEKLLSHLNEMLSNVYSIRGENDLIKIELIQEIVEQMSNFISIDQYIGKMKELQLSARLLTIVDDIQDEAIHFQIYRILAAILTEKDIKTLASPDKIVTIFLKKIINISNNISEREPLSNILIAVKSLVQHDQIKDEIVKQQGLSLLIRCATEPELIEQGEGNQWSLEILLALTFNKEAFNNIKNNTEFIQHLKTLLHSTDDDEKRFAESILWKIEQDKKDVESTTVSSNDQYDIMLSYSHRNKDLCYAIYDRLIKDGFRVWIDRENMYGSPMDAMAYAIENSKYILVCMSEAYKQSPCCQLEAQYAFQKRRPLIPLVMTQRYKPDGWLGIIVSGKIYIDIPKLTIDSAYLALKKEINAYLKQRNTTEEVSSQKTPLVHNSVSQIPATSKTLPITGMTSDAQRSIVKYPNCIDEWSDDHVRSFLIERKLTSLLPVVVDMDGCVLHMIQIPGLGEWANFCCSASGRGRC